MSDIQFKDVTKEQAEALELAEDSRETEWNHPSFVAELFMGRFRSDLISPFPEQDPQDKKEGDEYLAKLEKFLKENYDADEADRVGKIDPKTIQGLKDIGAFGMKIPKEYGGLGLSQTNYSRALGMTGSHCASLTGWLSAHQSIGVPQPLKMFGTPEQKKKYLSQLSQKVSAFALTEPGVGSDPAGMTTTAEPTPDGKHFIINGRKLWCTNGAVAEILVVMAKTPPKIVNGKERKQITAFIVEADTPGFKVVHRCKFMGLNGIENALLEFKNVKVPRENIIWGEGQGLKLALMTLNTGRISLPAGVVGGARKVLEMVRQWVRERVQWGVPIGKHEEIAAKVSNMAALTFAMDATTMYTSSLVDKGGADIRLEASMCKLFSTEWSWKAIYDGIQILGGRGFENAQSLQARGEKGYPIERMMRDARINTILEGSTEIMHLFIAREALDAHMRLSKDLLSPRTSIGKKVATFFKAAAFYALWYPRQWIHFGGLWPMHTSKGSMGKHFRYIARRSHKLARSIFHMMMIHQLGLERRQLILARIVEIGTDLFAMAATASKAHAMVTANPNDRTPLALADEFCDTARTRVEANFKGLFFNKDRASHKLTQNVMKDKYLWLEEGVVRGNIADPKLAANGVGLATEREKTHTPSQAGVTEETAG